MMKTTNTGIRAISPLNGVFTLFGSPIVLTTPPSFNCHSGELQFHGDYDVLHPVTNPSLQPQPGPAVPNIVPPLNHGPGAGPSSSRIPQSLASCAHFTELLTSSGPPILIEPLAPGPSFREPVVSGHCLPVGFPPGFRSLSPLPSSSHDLPPAKSHLSCHLSHSEAITSGSQVCEPLPAGFCLPDALSPYFPLSDSKEKGKKHLINEAAQRRQIRMSKNRASASRSRARRRAYTAELEREIQYLKEENDRIRRETAEMHFVSTKQETTRRRWFGRAASPPF